MAMEVPLVRGNSAAVPSFRPPPAHGERRITHYSSLQKILLVGEGDFSFSNALATAFGHGHNIIATSLDSQEMVLKKYADAAAFTIGNLKKLGALLFHEVDATCMAGRRTFCNLAFDCVVYNFPHAGFHGPEDNKRVIKKHKELVKLFFANAAKLLRFEGEVHVSHKVCSPYTEWKLEKQAAKSGLLLKEARDFYQADYPGYVNRRGDGSDSAGTFHLGACKTFIFKINPVPFNPWRELPHLLGRRSLCFFQKMIGRRHAASACVAPFPLQAEQRAFNFCRERPFRRIMGPPVASLPMQNILSMKRGREDEEAYGVQDWEILEQQRFAKRGCFGLLPTARDRDARSCNVARAPPTQGLALRPFPPPAQLLLRPFEGRMRTPQHLRGMMFGNVRMHPSALLPSFH